MAEVKRKADHYDSHLLQEKYDTIRSYFHKYKEVRLTGLSMADM